MTLSSTYVSEEGSLFVNLGKTDRGFFETRGVLGVREKPDTDNLDLSEGLMWRVEFWGTLKEEI
jgi:hypothetical protein